MSPHKKETNEDKLYRKEIAKISKLMKKGMDEADEEMRKAPRLFKPGEGVEDVVSDCAIDPDPE